MFCFFAFCNGDKWLSKWREEKWANPPTKRYKPHEVFHTIGSSLEIFEPIFHLFSATKTHTHTLQWPWRIPHIEHSEIHTQDEDDGMRESNRWGQLILSIVVLITKISAFSNQQIDLITNLTSTLDRILCEYTRSQRARVWLLVCVCVYVSWLSTPLVW